MSRIAALAMMVLIAGFSMNSFAESAMELEERCKTYAKEDGVQEAEMEIYMKECIDSLSAPAEEDSEEAPAAEENAPASE